MTKGGGLRMFNSQGRAAAIAVVITLSLASGQKRVYSPREKAFYADASAIQFVRPGLSITINSAKIAADGTITAVYTITDPSGLPLDSTGVTTPGTVAMSLIAAVLPTNQTEYTSYTTRVSAGTMLSAAIQAAADSGGVTTQLAPGQYQYVFKTKAPSGFDQTATHTIRIYGSRNLTVYNLGTNYASATFNF